MSLRIAIAVTIFVTDATANLVRWVIGTPRPRWASPPAYSYTGPPFLQASATPLNR